MFNKIKRFLSNIHLHNEPDAKPITTQLSEIIWLALHYRFSPIEYEAYRFYLKEQDKEKMLTYLSNYEVTNKLRAPLYDQRMLVILNNKLLFNRFFLSAGLPLPEFLGYYDEESGFLADGNQLKNQEDFTRWINETDIDELVIKPAGGLQGFGVIILSHIFRNNHSVSFEDTKGKNWTVKELLGYLNQGVKQSRYPGFILEKRIVQNPLISQINSSSINTCRILTFKYPDGSIDIPFAVMRFGRKSSHIDSWSQGGIACGIEVDKGTLKKGSYNPSWGTTRFSSVHPDSDYKLEGFSVPDWDDAKNLAIKAASIIPGIKSIGWDVAISDKGPVLVEGNSTWDPIFIQSINEGFLTPRNKEKLKLYRLTFR